MNNTIPPFSDPKGNTKKFRESTVHGTPQFPMQVYANNFDWYDNHIIDWHWHPELEFAVVLSGKVTCYLNDTCFQLKKGEGIFINSNTMHMEAPSDDSEKAFMTTVCFLPDFIGDCGGELIYKKYVRPIVGDGSLKGMTLSSDVEWQGKILKIITDIFEASEKREWGFELKLHNMLSGLWYLLVTNIGKNQENSETISNKTDANELRLKEMLSFIHENYQRELSVEEIARSANISKSECFRCFKAVIDKKPIAYLNEYRLWQAANLLVNTATQITEICFSCGFNHISYFGKIFRNYYGMSPKEFRKANK